ncbi:MAG TPA: phosphatidylglycerol lysyltransferase [Spirochaetales bacterium]|nr:phosphatidylglycerol lysyltransferase [Spirochaetales bacterium]
MISHPATGFDIGDPEKIPLSKENAPTYEGVLRAAGSLVLSASGWRKVFAALPKTNKDGTKDELEQSAEDSLSPAISAEDKVLCALMAKTFADYLCTCKPLNPVATVEDARVTPTRAVILGIDSRPTGPAMADIFARVFIGMGIEVHYCYIISAPEIMAYAASAGRLPPEDEPHADGFAYISASHNPPGHNGVKFGLATGGVLPPELVEPLIVSFRSLLARPDCVQMAIDIMSAADTQKISACYVATSTWKRRAVSAYTLFTHEVVTGKKSLEEQGEFLDALAQGCQERPIGVVGELNGSARSLSIDKDYLEGLGVRTLWYNDTPRAFAHRIVPEGESLLPCAAKLELARDSDAAFELGYVPDCDGDRGNLVYYDPNLKRAVTLEAQEVFALSCIAELATMALEVRDVRTRLGAENADNLVEKSHLGNLRVAIVVNDATSMRIERIARLFGAQVFRAETGEANAVALADSLRNQGWTVRILGEGSNGGNITYPSRVRDPLATLSAMLKLLRYKDKKTGKNPFEIWLETSSVDYESAMPTSSAGADHYRPDFCLSDIMATLPRWSTTSVFEERAMLRVASTNHAELKAAYQKVFLREWEQQKAALRERFGIESWRALATNGIFEKDVSSDFAQAGKGGLRIVFSGTTVFSGRKDIAFLWMRGSGTEPVLRIMADIAGGSAEDEAYLLDWQTWMVKEADKS